MLLSTLIAIAVLGYQPVSTTTAEGVRVDAAALREGLQTRLGDASADWSVEVGPIDPQAPRLLAVRLQGSNGQELRLAVEVLGDDATARAVELAAAITLALEDADADATAVDSSPASVPERSGGPAAAGWVGAEGRVSTNVRTDVGLAGGAALRGGMWLLGGHLQPLIGLAWGHARRGNLHIHALSLEACGLAGGWVGQRVWLGAGGCVAARRALALDRGRAVRWGAALAVPVRAQVRVHPRVVLSADAGLGVTPTPLRFLGEHDRMRWHRLRFTAGLGVAVTLGELRGRTRAPSSSPR